MSQILGTRRTLVNDSSFGGRFQATVQPTDNLGNNALATIAYGPNNTSYVDDTNGADATPVFYYLDKAPDADPAGAVWRVCRATITSPGLSRYEWGCTVNPLTGALVSCGNYDHLLADIRKTVAVAPAPYPVIAYN